MKNKKMKNKEWKVGFRGLQDNQVLVNLVREKRLVQKSWVISKLDGTKIYLKVTQENVARAMLPKLGGNLNRVMYDPYTHEVEFRSVEV